MKIAAITLGVCLAVGILLTGCTTPPTSAPTYTPLPTYTPFPTPTLAPGQPTYTPAPTYTPLPTYTAGPTPTQAPAQTLKIGVSQPFTGPAGWVGTAVFRGFEMAATDINSRGGLLIGGKRYMIQYVSYDDKYTAADGVTVANTLIFKDNVKFILGPTSSAGAAASLALVEENKVFRLVLAAARQGQGPYSFMGYPNTDTYNPALWSYDMKNHPEWFDGGVAIINPNTASGQTFKATSERTAQVLGLKVAWSKLYEANISDFTPVLVDLLSSKPTYVDLCYVDQTQRGIVIKRLRELGYKGPISTFAYESPSYLLQSATLEQLEGYAFQYGNFGDQTMSAEERAYYDKYMRLYGEPFYPISVDAYVDVQVFAQAMVKTQSLDPTVVRDAVKSGMEFNTLLGLVKFVAVPDAPGAYEALSPRYFSVFRQGKIVPYFTESLEEITHWAEVMRKK